MWAVSLIITILLFYLFFKFIGLCLRIAAKVADKYLGG